MKVTVKNTQTEDYIYPPRDPNKGTLVDKLPKRAKYEDKTLWAHEISNTVHRFFYNNSPPPESNDERN